MHLETGGSLSRRNDMINYRVIVSLAVAALVAGACRSSGNDPIPAGLPGSYVYAGKGSTFKKQWEFSARLDLTPDHRYALTLDKAFDGNADRTETDVGTYTVSGDHIQLREERSVQGKSQDMHKLQIKADSLIAEVGWTAELFIKGMGAPNVVFVKRRG
jgi:hypothetical protein